MLELLCHLVGDYVFQNHWMATQKVNSVLVAMIHAIFYTIPFVVMFDLDLVQIALICLTHAFIDHFRVAKLWCDFWGIGNPGKVMPLFSKLTFVSNEVAPPFLGVWLLIIVDNTLHLAINHLAINYLGV